MAGTDKAGEEEGAQFGLIFHVAIATSCAVSSVSQINIGVVKACT